MKITKSRLKQIIKEEIIESGGSAHSSGPPTTPDLITIMEKIPKIDTAAQEDLFA